MQETEQNGQPNEVQIIKNSLEVLHEGPDILIANRERKMKALVVGNNLLSLIRGAGMTPELDERCKKFLINCAAANTKMKEDRAGVTQIMDKLKSMYTEVENELDVKKDGSIPSRIQYERNAYVKKCNEEAEQKRKDAERQQREAQARIDVRAKAEQMLSEFFNNMMLVNKQKITTAFNNLQLEGFADAAALIRTYYPEYKQEMHRKFSPMIPAAISQDEVDTIVTEVRDGKFDEYANRYVREMTEQKNDIVDKSPSKLEELKREKALADEQEAARVKAEAATTEQAKIDAQKEQQRLEEERKLQEHQREEREKQEQLRLQNEAAENQKKEIQESQVRHQGETAMAMFEKEAEVATVSNTPETKISWNIKVLHPVGYTQLFALWFEKIGKDLPIDKIGNTKLDQMKGWAEKEYTKSGTKIDSKFLEYEQDYKAVNRKNKEA